MSPVAKTDRAALTHLLDMNLVSCFLSCSAAINAIARSGKGGRIMLRSTVSGTLGAIGATPGTFVEQGRELFHVVDLDRLWLEVQVPEADAPHVQPGMGVSLEVDAYRDRKFAGVVSAINPAIDPALFQVP